MKSIYLDHNSTSPIDPLVAEVVAECFRAGYVNPASQHKPGRQARRMLEQAREGIASLLGANMASPDGDRLIFTSGATEANNLILRGLLTQSPGRLIVSSIEHPSVLKVAEQLKHEGFQVAELRVLRDGVVDLDHLSELIDYSTQLVSVMFANHETGVIQPVAEIASICQQANVPFHTDATQAVGKIDVHFQKSGATAMSLSGHKFGGPHSIGALLVRGDFSLNPILFGGFQQLGMRPGTESVALPAGMHKALELACQSARQQPQPIASLRDRLENLLQQQWPELKIPPLIIHGQALSRLPNTSNISFPGLDRQALLMALDLAGVACSSGSACASGSAEPSPVLMAMGCPEDEIQSSIRLSLGRGHTTVEIDLAVSRILSVCNTLRDRKAANISAGMSRQ